MDFPPTSTDVPVISCEATDFSSSASSIGKSPGWKPSYGLCGEVVAARHLTVGVPKLRLLRPSAHKTRSASPKLTRMGRHCTWPLGRAPRLPRRGRSIEETQDPI